MKGGVKKSTKKTSKKSSKKSSKKASQFVTTNSSTSSQVVTTESSTSSHAVPQEEEECSLRALSALHALDRLAEAAYDGVAKASIDIDLINRNGTKVTVKAILDGQTINGVSSHPHLRLYKFSWNGRHHAVFVSRGTHMLCQDLMTDFELANLDGDVPARFTSSQKYVTSMMKSNFVPEGTRVLFIGHSLGAAEAEYLAVCFNKESIGFDNPGCGHIIHRSLRHMEVVKSNHLTVNGPPNIINRSATWFTGGPVGEILHGNDGIFDCLDMLLSSVMLLFVVSVFQAGVSSQSAVIFFVAGCLIFALICYFTMLNHSMKNRHIIVYYTENAPASGHLILFVALMVCLLVWLGVNGVKWTFNGMKWTVDKVKHSFG